MNAIDLYGWYRHLLTYWNGGDVEGITEFKESEIPKINADTFSRNPNLAQWEKLAKKRDVKNFIIANFLQDNYGIKSFNEPSYTQWCRVNESLMYVFKNDMETIQRKGGTLNLLKLRLDYNMSRESIIMMNELFDKPTPLEKLWLTSPDKMARDEALKLQKYKQFLLPRVDLQKCKAALKQVAAEAI